MKPQSACWAWAVIVASSHEARYKSFKSFICMGDFIKWVTTLKQFSPSSLSEPQAP
jgi:hypothetical protein